MTYEINEENLNLAIQKMNEEYLQKQAKVKDLLENPEKIRKVLTRLIASKYEHIYSELFEENLVSVTEDEFNTVFDTIMQFLTVINKTYNKMEVDSEAHFPTTTGHLIFGAHVITVEEMYGQGTASYMKIEDLDLALDTNIPMSAISEIEKFGLTAIENSEQIFEKQNAIETIQDSMLSLDGLLESETISQTLKMKLLTTKAAMSKEINLIEEDIKTILS